MSKIQAEISVESRQTLNKDNKCGKVKIV